MGDERVRMRPGCTQDLPALLELLSTYGMSGEITPAECLVAAGPEGLMGFARVEVADGLPFLRPIVVAPEYQHQGIGRRLVQHLLDQLPELRVVARGEAVGFYTRLGFEPTSWEAAPLRFRQECEVCPDSPTCRPVPMIYGEVVNTQKNEGDEYLRQSGASAKPP